MKMKNIRNHVSKVLGVFTIGLALSIVGLAGTTKVAQTRTSPGKYRVSAYQSVAHNIALLRGERVDVVLEGDGFTNLDLYVYDSRGNLCAQRVGMSDLESMTLNIFASDNFTIVVVNRGSVFNDYNLYVQIQ